MYVLLEEGGTLNSTVSLAVILTCRSQSPICLSILLIGSLIISLGCLMQCLAACVYSQTKPGSLWYFLKLLRTKIVAHGPWAPK